jgi:hypothetical protein
LLDGWNESASGPVRAEAVEPERPVWAGEAPTCLFCGMEVEPRPTGCKHPCPNCGFLYPLGDCSD